MTIDEVVQRMAKANPRWATPSGADLQCYVATARLHMSLTEHGHRARVVEAIPWSGVINHFAVLLDDDRVVDLTMRQFHTTAPYPLVAPLDEWLSEVTRSDVGEHDLEIYDEVSD